MKRIESRDNKWVKRLNGLKIKKNRDKEGVFVAEGLRFISEVPANWAVEAYVISDTFANENDISMYEDKAEVLCMPDTLFASVCDTENPQGILAVCKKLSWDTDAVFAKEKPFFILAENAKRILRLISLAYISLKTFLNGMISGKEFSES